MIEKPGKKNKRRKDRIRVDGQTGSEYMMTILDKKKCTPAFRWDWAYYELDKKISIKEVAVI